MLGNQGSKEKGLQTLGLVMQPIIQGESASINGLEGGTFEFERLMQGNNKSFRIPPRGRPFSETPHMSMSVIDSGVDELIKKSIYIIKGGMGGSEHACMHAGARPRGEFEHQRGA